MNPKRFILPTSNLPRSTTDEAATLHSAGPISYGLGVALGRARVPPKSPLILALAKTPCPPGDHRSNTTPARSELGGGTSPCGFSNSSRLPTAHLLPTQGHLPAAVLEGTPATPPVQPNRQGKLQDQPEAGDPSPDVNP